MAHRESLRRLVDVQAVEGHQDGVRSFRRSDLLKDAQDATGTCQYIYPWKKRMSGCDEHSLQESEAVSEDVYGPELFLFRPLLDHSSRYLFDHGSVKGLSQLERRWAM